MRLRNPNAGIPGGIQFLQSESGWDTEKLPDVKGRSLRIVSLALQAHRVGNPWLAKKHGWALDLPSIESEVQERNALRMYANPKFRHFIIDDAGGSSFSGPFSFPRASQLAGAVVGQVKKVAAGVGVLLDWLGSSGRAVPKELAEKRAGVCVLCPQNRDGDWTSVFTKPVSEMLRLQLGIKNDLKLTTSKDEQLHICLACACPLKLKVHTPIRHIVDNMDEETKSRLQPEEPVCWIKVEAEESR